LNTHITSFVHSNNQTPPPLAGASNTFCTAIAHLTALSSLCLDYQHIDMHFLCGALRHFPALTSLSLRGASDTSEAQESTHYECECASLWAKKSQWSWECSCCWRRFAVAELFSALWHLLALTDLNLQISEFYVQDDFFNVFSHLTRLEHVFLLEMPL
jgi:hypothetical protein